MKQDQEIEALATYVHGTLAGLHGLAFVFNLKRRKYGHCAVHAAFFAYDLIAALRHRRESWDAER